MKIQRYGWRRDLPDFRDAVRGIPVGEPPASVDLRPKCPPVYDQGQTGSCTANAIAAALEYEMVKQGMAMLAAWTPSRLFIYWNERSADGDPGVDHGSSIRTGMKVVSSDIGYCKELLWPFDPAKVLDKPDQEAFDAAKKHAALKYERVPQVSFTLEQMLTFDTPFVFGFTVYESFESPHVALTGVVPMPSPSESVIGGHAVMAVGYDHALRVFIVRNSWGPGWGAAGYCYMPYDYVLNPNLAADFWTVETVR